MFSVSTFRTQLRYSIFVRWTFWNFHHKISWFEQKLFTKLRKVGGKKFSFSIFFYSKVFIVVESPIGWNLCEHNGNFHTVLSPQCMAEDSRCGEGFQVFLDRGCPRIQLASSSSAPRARRCGKKKVLDQLTSGTSSGMTKPAVPSLGGKLLRWRRRRSSTDGT